MNVAIIVKTKTAKAGYCFFPQCPSLHIIHNLPPKKHYAVCLDKSIFYYLQGEFRLSVPLQLKTEINKKKVGWK